MSSISDFESALKEHGYNMTTQRRELFKVLSNGDTFTMNQLVQRLKGKMERTSVYRGIELFEKIAVVNRVQIGWKYKLELTEKFSNHHHHATCMKCGEIVTFEENEKLKAGIHELANELGYGLTGHTLELRGHCDKCKTSNLKKQKSLLLPAHVQNEYTLEQVHKTPSNKNITAVFALVTNKNGQLLAVKNDRGWDIPGGHVEPGETYAKALEREVLEEAYTEIRNISPLLLATTKPDAQMQYSMLFYRADVKTLQHFKNENETTQREFLTPQELVELYGGGKPDLMIQVLKMWQSSL